MFINRKITKEVIIGSTKIGGANPILIQSMTNTNTCDINATINQIHRLEEAGCEIVRVTVPNNEAALAIKEIKNNIKIPLVADIHFDYRLAIESIKQGVDKLRINPGNIGDKERIKAVVDTAKEYNVPIRIGVNSGSLEKDILNKYGRVTAEGLVESAERHIKILENLDYDNIVVSIKSSNVLLNIDALKLFSQRFDYPVHIGITEAGTLKLGTIKSSVGLGILLYEGIGDTVRVSLTDDPVQEVICAKSILQSLNIRTFGIEIVSCPTCGRTKIDLIKLAKEVEDRTRNINKNIKVAIMGCAVNGPGEAKEADIGIAGGDKVGLIFKKGKIIRKVPEDKLLDELMKEIDKM